MKPLSRRMVDTLFWINKPGGRAYLVDCRPPSWFVFKGEHLPLPAIRSTTVGCLIRMGLLESFSGKKTFLGMSIIGIAVITEKGQKTLEKALKQKL